MNIIEKEKARQEGYLEQKELAWQHGKALCSGHEQSLINLKEYMEETLDSESDNNIYDYEQIHDVFVDELKRDIKELTKMIAAYSNEDASFKEDSE